MARTVLAIDPGRSKCGMAVVDCHATVLFRAVVETGEVVARAVELAGAWRPETLVVGDGTGAKPVIAALREACGEVPLARVDEKHTSELARARFVEEVAPRGWRRLLPPALRAPEAAYDDFVAVILAERWWLAHPADDDRDGEDAPSGVSNSGR